jgi:hypothetical protein
MSSTFLSGIVSKAEAAPLFGTPPIKIIREKSEPITAIPEAFAGLMEQVNKVTDWFNDLPHTIAEMSVSLMAWLYDLCAQLILTTPLWIFNNEWFENTTYLFSMLSIGLVSVLTIVEAIKRMVSGLMKKNKYKPMELKTILTRWFIVAGVTTAVPWLFQKAFQGLNKVSDLLIAMGADTMRSVALPATITTFDVITLCVFDLVLISTMVPILWKNGRRFFDLMVLGVVAPVALTAWIFDSYRSYFKQWWERVKHLSLVQVYYALFLLILGWFIFGVPTPQEYTGLIVKLLVVIGGFARMVSPPRMIQKHFDNGPGLDENIREFNAARKTTIKRVKTAGKMITNPKAAVVEGAASLLKPKKR